MNGKAAKEHRRTARAGALMAVDAVRAPIEAAINNEIRTRERVDDLEAVLRRGLRGRLRWLLTGK